MSVDLSRRTLSILGGTLSLAAVLDGARPVQAQAGSSRPVVALLVYPDMIMLDLVGPLTVLSIMGADIHLVGRTKETCSTDTGIPVTPTLAIAECPPNLDVLFVPGGLKGSVAVMQDAEMLSVLADRGSRARYVTSVCTGALVLGAAGLLRGHRATSHWYVRDLLDRFGATVATDRVVVDRNRITAGGVTAGLDFGLTLVAMMRDEASARRIQLLLEYAPNPPFDAGEPETAGADLTNAVLRAREPLIAQARSLADRFAQRGSSR